MIARVAVVFFIAELLGNEGEPSARVGPIAIGQTRAQIESAFGRGQVTPDCDGARAGACGASLAYTDGAATLTVRFPHVGNAASIEIEFASPARRLPRLPRAVGSLATWQFQGVAAGRFPPGHVHGWSTAEYTPGAGCAADFETPDITATFRCAEGSTRISEFALGEH